jgi:hypothetical protein
MGVFSFPRIHVKGLISVNVGTGNNDDYSAFLFPEGSPYAGKPLRLADSVNVRPLTYGMSDAEWVRWVQQPHPFVKPTPPSVPLTIAAGHVPDLVAQRASMTKAETPHLRAGDVSLIPAEWNYFGDMSLEMMGVRVLAVQYPGRTATNESEDTLIGAELSFKNRPGDTGRTTGLLIDVNPEDVPASQIHADALTLEKSGTALLTGKPTKASTRWINFQRNTTLRGANAAAGSFQCVIPIDEVVDQPIVEMLSRENPFAKPVKGIVFRYCIYRSLQKISAFKYPDIDERNRQMVALYAERGLNPDFSEIVGTLAPWYGEEMLSSSMGRLLLPANTFPVPQAGGTSQPFSLAPATLLVSRELNLVSVDFSATFPDRYASSEFDPLQTGDNPKHDFGPVHLLVRDQGREHDLGPVLYQDTVGGDRQGWIFDFPLDSLSEEVLVAVEAGTFALHHESHGDLLAEAEYLIASDQSCIIGEQGRPGSVASSFMSQGPSEEPAIVRVFRRGQELTSEECPDITVWEYDTTPNEQPGDRKKLSTAFKPGQPLEVSADRPGNRFYTFTLAGQPEPPANYGGYSPRDLMISPQINLRLLSNDRDYSEYYQNPEDDQPVGNDKLTFEVIFREVLQNYYLLYPAMSLIVPLNDPEQWSGAEMAGRMMQRTQKSWWPKAGYMPRTRDLSESRRKLLHAWCLKFLT